MSRGWENLGDEVLSTDPFQEHTRNPDFEIRCGGQVLEWVEVKGVAPRHPDAWVAKSSVRKRRRFLEDLPTYGRYLEDEGGMSMKGLEDLDALLPPTGNPLGASAYKYAFVPFSGDAFCVVDSGWFLRQATLWRGQRDSVGWALPWAYLDGTQARWFDSQGRPTTRSESRVATRHADDWLKRMTPEGFEDPDWPEYASDEFWSGWITQVETAELPHTKVAESDDSGPTDRQLDALQGMGSVRRPRTKRGASMEMGWLEQA